MENGAVRRFNATNLPAPKVPLSHGVVAGDWLYVSGMVPRTGAGEILEGDAKQATLVCLENLRDVVTSAGGTTSDVVKINVYLADFDDYAAMNEAFAEFFGGAYPARTTIQAGRLGLGDVEIDAVAYLPRG